MVPTQAVKVIGSQKIDFKTQIPSMDRSSAETNPLCTGVTSKASKAKRWNFELLTELLVWYPGKIIVWHSFPEQLMEQRQSAMASLTVYLSLKYVFAKLSTSTNLRKSIKAAAITRVKGKIEGKFQNLLIFWKFLGVWLKAMMM